MAIAFIVGIILVVFIVAGFIAAYNMYDNGNPVGGTIAVVVAIVSCIAFFIVPFSIRTVNSGEVAVVKHLGEIKEVKTAGTYYDSWITNKYIKYDAMVQNVDIETAAYSSDAQTMNVQMTLQYQIVSDHVVEIATQYGSLKTLENRIQSIATEKSKSVLSSYKAMDIIANRSSISPAVESAIKDAIGEEYYVNVVAVVLTNIDFSDAFELAVEEKMIAEQAKLKAEYENETKIAQAEAAAAAKIKETQAEIEIAQAKADAELKKAQAQVEIAKAEAEALKIAAQAEADANEIIDGSITDKILEKIYADAWDGSLPAVVGNGDYILPSDIFNTEN